MCSINNLKISHIAGELLMLPQSFGNIFLGETFVSYLSVNNESNFDVGQVTLKVS